MIEIFFFCFYHISHEYKPSLVWCYISNPVFPFLIIICSLIYKWWKRKFYHSKYIWSHWNPIWLSIKLCIDIVVKALYLKNAALNCISPESDKTKSIFLFFFFFLFQTFIKAIYWNTIWRIAVKVIIKK